MTRIAIVGAGISGLMLGQELASLSEVTIFEKSRGVGGRVATRSAEPYQFDHGAQFFIAKTDEFIDFLKPLIGRGVVATWDPKFAEIDRDKIIATRKWSDENPHYVAAPKMNQLGKALCNQLDIRLNTPVACIEKTAGEWQLFDPDQNLLGAFDWVISAMPPAQLSELFPVEFFHMEKLKKVKMIGCYSLMLGYETPLALPYEAALILNADISWISENSSKPGRPPNYALLVHSTNAWAEAHLEDEQSEVIDFLLRELKSVTGFDVDHADHIALHRWRYANIGKQHGETSFVDEGNKLAACGDWFIQGRIESAFLSASDLAARLLAKLS